MVTLDEFIDKLNKIREENKGKKVYVYANDSLGYVNELEDLNDVYAYHNDKDPDNVVRLVIEVV